jgi:hypothetical protein
LGQSEVFEDGSTLLEKLLGLNMSAKQIQRVSESYGRLIEDKEQNSIANEEGLSAKKQKDLTYVMVDGSMIFTREEGWKEIKVGRIFSAESIVQVQKKRKEISQSVYLCHIGKHTDFLAKVNNHAECYLNKVCIGDGAKWIWNWADDIYPDMVQILDLFHALEKLSEYAKAQYPDIIEKNKWIETQKEFLLTDKVNAVIKTVVETIPTTTEAKKTQEALISYYSNNQTRMLYGTYKEMGYCLGSGAIESAHRNVVQQRLKLSGQRWSLNGAQQIVNLRAYYKSNRWDEVIEIIKQAA